MKTHKIDSYSALVQLIERRYFKEQSGRWIFRGHSKRSYKLIPSVSRLVHTSSSRSKLERSLLGQFKRQAIPYLTRVPSNDFEWLASAQHHGLPTRLLDWSLNPQVALYFAVSENQDDDAVVFALRATTRIGDQSVRTKDPLDLHTLRKFTPSIVTSRLAAQEGLFTIHIDLDVPLEEESRDDWELEAICIPASLKKRLAYLLFRLGVHYSSLFPGIDGLAQHIRWTHTVSPELPKSK